MVQGATGGKRARAAVLAACLCVLLAAAGAVGARAGDVAGGPGKTHIRESRGKFIPVPDSIPHVEGAYIDKRIRNDLEWIADHFKILVVEGFAGRLPSGTKVGCPACHVSDSEHKIGVAVDLIPLVKPRCDRTWHGIDRLAKWAEPQQNEPQPPFRWVGYDGDANHGCGDHLHLSWIHDDDYRKSRPSDWVMTFR